jgi:peroxiredoxin
MSNRLILLVFFLISLKSYAQNPKELLQKSYSKCATIQNGYYDMNMKFKFMDFKDTSWNIDCRFYFNKLNNDSLYSIAFNSELFSDGNYIRDVLYTGNEFVTLTKYDSSAIIMSKNKWINKLMDLRHNYFASFYMPFTDKNHFPLPRPDDYTDNRHTFKFIATESINNMQCFHVQMIEIPIPDSNRIYKTIETTYDYWINSKDTIPVKYSVQSKNLKFTDTLSEFSSLTLKNYDLNNDQNLIPLKLSWIPSYYTMKDYVAETTIPLLRNDTIAPSFTLTSLDSKSVSLSDFKGKLVLLDFFYKDCYPCVKSLPGLQALHEKYKAKGLKVIGIDAVDEKSDDVKHLLSIAGISYQILMDKKDVAKQYHVYSYPTAYLIDKNGTVIYSESGYDDSSKNKLEQAIKSNL